MQRKIWNYALSSYRPVHAPKDTERLEKGEGIHRTYGRFPFTKHKLQEMLPQMHPDRDPLVQA